MRMSESMTAGSSPALPPEEQVDLAVEVFHMLADATRVRLLWLLQGGESPVSELTAAVSKPQSLVSQHLAKLRMARLVLTRREGSHIYYRLANEHVSQLVADAIHNAEHYGPGVPAHHQRSPVGKVHETTRTPRRGRAT
jgi:ArsR family transcriptional regulator